MVYVLIQFLAKIHLTLDYTHHYTVTSTYLSYPAAAVGECTAVLSELELHRELAVIGDWQNLCLHLGVDGGTLDRLKFSSKQVEVKKTECLSAYYKLGEGKVCWERVVRVVSGSPFQNHRLGDNISRKYLR